MCRKILKIVYNRNRIPLLEEEQKDEETNFKRINAERQFSV